MNPRRILISDRFDAEAFASLKGDSRFVVERSETLLPSGDEMKDVEGLLIRSRTPIDADFLSRAPALRVVVTATSGFDHIDLRACFRRNVKVMFTPEANADSAAELTWALVLACARKVPDAHRAVKGGEWRRDSLLGRQLAGKTYGIVGLGRIGTRVAKIAQAFGMKTIAFDPYKDDEHFRAARTERFGLEELFMLSDVASLHIPASDETKGIIHRYLLDSANRSLILVNTSRGPVISEQDLVEALTLQWISGCGLDVFEREPLPRHSGLLGFSNVVLSPHIGAATTEAFAQASWMAAEKIKSYFLTGAVTDPLPPEDPWWKGGFSKDSLRAPYG